VAPTSQTKSAYSFFSLTDFQKPMHKLSNTPFWTYRTRTEYGSNYSCCIDSTLVCHVI